MGHLIIEITTRSIFPRELRRENIEVIAPVLGESNEQLKIIAALLLAQLDYQWDSIKSHVVKGLSSEFDGFSQPAQQAIESSKARFQSVEAQLFQLLINDDAYDQDTVARLFIDNGDLSEHQAEQIVGRFFQTEEALHVYTGSTFIQSDNVLSALIKTYPNFKADLKTEVNALFADCDHIDDKQRKQIKQLLGDAVKSNSEEVSLSAAVAMAHLEPASSAQLALLTSHLFDDESFELNWTVFWALSQLEDISEATPELLRILKSQTEMNQVETEVLQLLTQVGPAAAPAVPIAIELLQNKELFSSANELIAAVGPEAKSATPALLKHLKHPDRMWDVAVTLEKVKAPSDQVLAVVKDNLNDPFLKHKAIPTIGLLGEIARELRPVLIETLNGDDVSLAETAAIAIGRLKPAPRYMIQQLVNGLQHKDRRIKISCAMAISSQAAEPDLCVPALIKLLDEQDVGVLSFTLMALTSFKEDAAPAVDKLMQLLEIDAFQVDCAKCLGAIGAPAKPAVEKLTLIAKGDISGPIISYRRLDAIKALGNIGPSAKSALPVLQDICNSDDENMKHEAAQAIKKILNNSSDQ